MVICVSGPVRQDEPNNQDVAAIILDCLLSILSIILTLLLLF